MIDTGYLQRQAHFACDLLQLCDVDIAFDLPTEYNAYGVMYMVSTRPDRPDKISIAYDPDWDTEYLLFLIMHQLRHAYQYYALQGGCSQSHAVLSSWREEFGTVPHDPSWQIELDANAFAVFILAMLKGATHKTIVQRFLTVDNDIAADIVRRADNMGAELGVLS